MHLKIEIMLSVGKGKKDFRTLTVERLAKGWT